MKLKNEAQSLVAKGSFLVSAHERHVAPFKTYLARTWSIKCTHKMQEGTLSGTGLSNYGEHLAFFHNQVDILDNLGIFTGCGKFFAHV